MEHSSILLEAEGIQKRFGGIVALDGVNFAVRSGEVHGLVGENGAGKSTLMKILSGTYRHDEGVIRVRGEEVVLGTPARALAHGIALVPQELDLLPHLSVMENIWFGRYTRRPGWRIDWNDLRERTRSLLSRLGSTVSPDDTVAALSVADRQMVAIARGLSHNAQVLLLDEPTSTLTPREVERLIRIVKGLKAEGVGVVFISHHLPEVMELCDRITVLRDGRYVGTYDRAAVTAEDVVQMMVGDKAGALYVKEESTVGEPVLIARDISSPGKLHSISLTVRRGEIVGIAGLVGAGRSELAHALFGNLPRTSGSISVNGAEVRIRSPRDAIRAGIALLPEDRQHQGLLTRMTIRENTTLAALQQFVRRCRIDRRKETEASRVQIDRLAVKATGPEQRVRNLSGGNQQKVVLGKWLLTDPVLLILDEPTRGIDVGAKAQIHRLISELARAGMGILLISSDLPEVLGLSDRVLVMYRGRIAAEFDRREATAEKIMLAATGGDRA
ncbi:MAG: D-xylose ABC transporter ATP-binding protein [Firmicutes bacterium]|nr:D-xylose ABC transporter ATP-binding protein [Bacillota bacterium]